MILRRFVGPLLTVLLASGPTSAQVPSAPAAPAGAGRTPRSDTHEYSVYEKEAIAQSLRDLGTSQVDEADGKIIESVEVVRLDVIEPRDPAPGFLNVFHVKSRPYVIEREVLLAAGQPYDKLLADETARNLRQLPQLSLVVVMPVRGSSPDRVKLLVMTKDVWSLRLSWDVSYTRGGLERLVIQPTETNILGTQQTVAARFALDPKAESLGARYVVPRLFGSRVAFVADANVILNRATGHGEGSFGTLSVSQPLWSTQTEWAWQTTATWRNEITRLFSNATVRTYDARATPGVDDRIPYEFETHRYTGSGSVTRSFGWAIKHDVTAGLEGSNRRYDAGDLSRFDPAAVSEYLTRKVPTSDKRVYPFVQLRAYTTSFLRSIDMETLSLQEDVRLGHDVYLRVYPVSESLGSSRSYFGTYAAAQYTWELGDGYARTNVSSTTEAESSRLADAAVAASARIVTPRLGFGRLVFDASGINRYRNFLNRRSVVGGDTGLRGYPTAFFDGKDALSYNLEFRTHPLHISTVQVGGAAFFDSGGAFDGFQRVELHQAVGGGLRVLFPQLDRLVFRVDVGVPLAPHGLPAGAGPVQYFVAFGQGFGVPGVGTPPLAPSASSPTASSSASSGTASTLACTYRATPRDSCSIALAIANDDAPPLSASSAAPMPRSSASAESRNGSSTSTPCSSSHASAASSLMPETASASSAKSALTDSSATGGDAAASVPASPSSHRVSSTCDIPSNTGSGPSSISAPGASSSFVPRIPAPSATSMRASAAASSGSSSAVTASTSSTPPAENASGRAQTPAVAKKLVGSSSTSSGSSTNTWTRTSPSPTTDEGSSPKKSASPSAARCRSSLTDTRGTCGAPEKRRCHRRGYGSGGRGRR